ncbi:MAG: cyclase family protein [Cyanobacteriota bacterium]|nr:cyclase family protein [Cyanobacteriota bacterium]
MSLHNVLVPSLLEKAKYYLSETVAQRANEVDESPNALFEVLQGLGNLDLLALRVPEVFGGKEFSEVDYGSFQELVARYSGALAFLQTQHQSAAGMLVAGDNSTLQQEYLPLMGSGEVLLGVGFSHLRRRGEPILKAESVPSGYRFDGAVPWITGFGVFQEFVVAATLPDGGAVFGIAPFQNVQQLGGGEITFNPPAKLAAMNSTSTVSANLDSWFLPEELVVSVKPPGWIRENDKKNLLRATFLAFGCAEAGLDIIKSAFEKKSLSFIKDAFNSLQAELNSCRSAINQAREQEVEFRQKLQLRAWIIDLATRIAHAGVTVSSGAANYSFHSAQRVYREALVFTVSGQSSEIMEATLARLTRNSTPTENQRQISYSRAIHLSHIIDENIPLWAGDPSVKFKTVADWEKDGYYLRKFSMGEHSATHVNAPISFYGNGTGIDEYSADSLVLPAVVIDICDSVAANPDYMLSIADIQAWENQHGEIGNGYLVLLRTGWQEKWNDEKAFFSKDVRGNMHFPGFDIDAAKLLIEKRNIAGIGIDTHGVDGGEDTSFSVNRLILDRPRIVLENLTNLEQLPSTGITIVIGILRLHKGSGSPGGIIALV